MISAPTAKPAITKIALPWASPVDCSSSGSPPGGVNSNIVISPAAKRTIAETRQARGSSLVSGVIRVSAASFKCSAPRSRGRVAGEPP